MTYFKKLALLPLLLISFINAKQVSPITSLEDLKPQIKQMLEAKKEDLKVTNESKEHFVERYFRPWNIEGMSFSSKQAQWGNGYKNKKMFNRDGSRVKISWFDKQIKNSRFHKFDKLKKRAITVRESELKVFPTTKDFYLDPSRPGEGYPFDYNINSAVKLNLPLYVSHYSKDRKWVFVESSTAAGWLKREDIAFVDGEFIKDFMTGDYYINTKDENNIYSKKNVFKKIKMGTLLPRKGDSLFVCDKNGGKRSKLKKIKLNEYISPMGIEMNYENIERISKNLLNEPYGWGGKDGLRDCSLLTKDFLSSFGIFLERNSRAQNNQGKKIKLSHLSNAEKKRKIIENGIPFLTLLYMNGHIMLYVGQKDNEPLIMHNVWTIKFDRNGKRNLEKVGKGVITTLNEGALSLTDKNSIVSKLKSMVFVNKS